MKILNFIQAPIPFPGDDFPGPNRDPFEPTTTIDEQTIWIVALIVFVACLIIMINTIKKLYKHYHETEKNKSIYWNNNKNNKERQ